MPFDRYFNEAASAQRVIDPYADRVIGANQESARLLGLAPAQNTPLPGQPAVRVQPAGADRVQPATHQTGPGPARHAHPEGRPGRHTG